jgi:hypothetical protein
MGKYQDAVDQIAASGDPEMLRWRNYKHPDQTSRATLQGREQLARWIQEKNSSLTQSTP